MSLMSAPLVWLALEAGLVDGPSPPARERWNDRRADLRRRPAGRPAVKLACDASRAGTPCVSR